MCLTFLVLLLGCATEPGKAYRIGEVMIVKHPDLLADQEGGFIRLWPRMA